MINGEKLEMKYSTTNYQHNDTINSSLAYYLNHDYGYMKVTKYFKINHEQLRNWVKKYQEHGLERLSRNKIVYDGNFKQYVVEYMHDNNL